MRCQSPIYSLLHQEIKACAEHLLEMGSRPDLTMSQDVQHILARLNELQDFAGKVHEEERYLPLKELKQYLENTMVCFEDMHHKLYSMRLSEMLGILCSRTYESVSFEPKVVHSVLSHFFRHFQEQAKPGHSLFYKLNKIKKLH